MAISHDSTTGPTHGRDARATGRGIGVPPMGSSAGPILPKTAPIDKRQGANLPHWSINGGTYFVTFRLADSLPAKIVQAWKQERDILLRATRGIGAPPMGLPTPTGILPVPDCPLPTNHGRDARATGRGIAASPMGLPTPTGILPVPDCPLPTNHGRDARATARGIGAPPMGLPTPTGILPVPGSPLPTNHGRDARATARGIGVPPMGPPTPTGILPVPDCPLPTNHGRDARATANTTPLLTPADAQRLRALFSERIEKYLDAGSGSCWMNRPEIAQLVADALLHFDTQRYHLLAWSVMPNHVHVVVRPLPGHDLSTILHSWKSFTAHKANKLLARTTEFWQPEPYDHLIRDQDDLAHCIHYTLNNPSRANLKNWKWCGIGGTPMGPASAPGTCP